MAGALDGTPRPANRAARKKQNPEKTLMNAREPAEE